MPAPAHPIVWRRTEMNGTVHHHDFTATFNGKGIGRIMCIMHHPNEGHWRWSFTLSVPGVPGPNLPPLHGIAETKTEAVEHMKRAMDLVCEVKAHVDLKAGRPPAGIVDHLCSYGACTLPGYGEPRLCYGHGRLRTTLAR